jgi:hypothetical protein
LKRRKKSRKKFRVRHPRSEKRRRGKMGISQMKSKGSQVISPAASQPGTPKCTHKNPDSVINRKLPSGCYYVADEKEEFTRWAKQARIPL